MFATFSFAEVPFATLDRTGSVNPVVISAGNFAKRTNKKKYKWYTIFGKLYRLTEKEYEAYLIQREAFQARIKDKTDDELFDIVEEAKTTKPEYKELADLIIKPSFEIQSLEIPLVNYKPDEHLLEIATKRLLEINRLKAIAKEKQRIQNLIDDELIIEMLLTSVF